MNHEPKFKIIYCGKRKGKKRYRLEFWIAQQGFTIAMGTGTPRKKKVVKYYIKMLKHAFKNMVGTTKIIEPEGERGKMPLTECCQTPVGPIVFENYCPNCGRKIIRE